MSLQAFSFPEYVIPSCSSFPLSMSKFEKLHKEPGESPCMADNFEKILPERMEIQAERVEIAVK